MLNSHFFFFFFSPSRFSEAKALGESINEARSKINEIDKKKQTEILELKNTKAKIKLQLMANHQNGQDRGQKH